MAGNVVTRLTTVSFLSMIPLPWIYLIICPNSALLTGTVKKEIRHVKHVNPLHFERSEHGRTLRLFVALFFSTLNDMELKSASDVAVYARYVCCSTVAVYRLQCTHTHTHTHTHARSTLTLSRSNVQRDCGIQTNGALYSAVEG